MKKSIIILFFILLSLVLSGLIQPELLGQLKKNYSLTIHSISWMLLTRTRMNQNEIVEQNSSSKSITILFNQKMIKELKDTIQENYSEIHDSTFKTADDIDYRIVCLIETPDKTDTLSFGKPRIMVYNNKIVKFNKTVFDIIADQLPGENKEVINRIKQIWKEYKLDVEK